MASSDVQILGTGTKNAPLDYVIPAAAEIAPKAVRAHFDGSGAGGAFLPTLVILSDAGAEVARIPTAIPVAAGASAEVSWFPHVGGAPLPPWTWILDGLSLNYGNLDHSLSYAWAMVQAPTPTLTVLVWLRIVLAGDYSPNAIPFQIVGLPPASISQSSADQRVTAPILVGISDPTGTSDLVPHYPAYVDAHGDIHPARNTDPLVNADNYKLGGVIFAGLGTYPWNPG